MSAIPNAAAAALVAALPRAETIADPYPLYRQLRPLTPVPGYRDYPPGTVPGQDEPVSAWVLMKYDEVAAAARDHATFSSRDPLQEQSSAPTLMLVNHDNPEHDRLRGLVNLAFSRKRIGDLQPWVRACVDAMFAAIDPLDCEVIGTLTSVLPARVMMRLFGQPDADAGLCRSWATAFMLSADLSPAERERSNQAMVTYFTARVMELDQLRESGKPLPEGLISALMKAEVDGQRLTLEEVIRFCVTLIVAGAETTTFLLANLLYNLATMPDITNQLRADRTLIGAFIDESLRHSGPPQRLFRIATRDVVVGGQTIRAGDWVALFFGAANHDPAMFPEPDRFDLSRDNLNRHLSMGMGIHHCLGFAVARLEASAVIEVALDRYRNISLGVTPPRAQTASLLTNSFESLNLNFEE